MTDRTPTPPLLGRRWTNPLPVVVVGTALWAVLAIVATAVGASGAGVAAVAWAGVVVGLLGGALFAWQLRAARRGSRGAQEGLVDRRAPDPADPR
ncbi:DUF2530 domain-containing protein [Millisia brevis]|uniref:DUF2530 domain-containing protein n=1 Tax=Millisia brevis TaxID=264148 RepID=UPI00082F7CAB|nr:DUF2530 domain-containing protein [Millisia brevis]